MARKSIPATGLDATTVVNKVRGHTSEDVNYKGGRTWSLVYWAGEEHHKMVEEAHNICLVQNALNPMAFKGLKLMEAEVVQMAAELFNGPSSAVGSMTSGGTESLLLTVKTYRDRARKKWPWIRRPNIVAPITIHPAFHKAAHLFGVSIRTVAVDKDGRVNPKKMKKAINRNTICVAASAPQYVTGVVDPIPEIAAMAAAKNLPMHVDACFGGFIQPWLERLGVKMPVWDFRTPGVTSISADLHKYGYSAKGASVLVFKDMSYLRFQFFVSTDWPGGIYLSPGLPGTRPGGPIASAWAALHGLGESGYLALAEQAWEVAQRLRAGIAKIDGLRVMGAPMSTIVTWTSTDPAVNVYAVADVLQAKGWSLDRQQNPASVHCTCNSSNLPVVDTYLSDLAESVAYVREHPELATEGEAAVYGLMSRLPVRGLVKSSILDVMEKMYAPGATGTPDLQEKDALQDAATKALALFDQAKDKLRSLR